MRFPSIFVASMLTTVFFRQTVGYDLIKAYLAKYGYLQAGSGVRRAVRAFQRDVGLLPSGLATARTLELMRRPRCGTPSLSSLSKTSRSKRFVPHTNKWDDRLLTWALLDPEDVLKPYDRYVVRNTLHRAFNMWQSAASGAIKFAETKRADEKADILVYFARGLHNDSLPFDGVDGVVAHGFYPTDGNLHFDAAERWTLNMGKGINLFQTSVHEIGHLLGLEHSADARAVMFPINKAYDPRFHLAADDIRGIRYVYAADAWRYHYERYMMRWRQLVASAQRH